MRAVFTFLLFFSTLFGGSGFQMIVLGAGGGPLETNLSSYMVAPSDSDHYVCIDAGSLLGGLYTAEKHLGGLDPLSALQSLIKGYLITHAHLDHVAGLIIASPNDSKKPIFGLRTTLNYIRDNLFNWKIWPNFGSEGVSPILNQYKYEVLVPGVKTPIPSTGMEVTAFLLSHPGGYESTAFLLSSDESALLFFGDTASDQFEKRKHMQAIWKQVIPLIKTKKLRHIFLECSYTNARPDKELYGHLKPKLWMKEFQNLARLIDPNDPASALKGLHAYAIHIKQPPNIADIIEAQLTAMNNLGLILHFPKQGEKLILEN